jgi:hypothetical protein
MVVDYFELAAISLSEITIYLLLWLIIFNTSVAQAASNFSSFQ